MFNTIFASAASRESSPGSHCLRVDFEIPDAAAMRTLGAAFTTAAIQANNDRLRVGLKGETGIGKTPFVKGMLSALPEKIAAVPDRERRPQNLWHVPDRAWLRHYDARLCENGFPDFLKPRAFDLPVVDIVENANCDESDSAFHCLIEIERAGGADLSAGDHAVTVTVIAPETFAGSAGFRDFLDQAAPFIPHAAMPV